MASPFFDAENERAGEPGEYHHSRNFTKKMAVGRSMRRESNTNRGERTIKSRSRVKKVS